MPTKKMLNQYRVTVKEYAKGKKPKTWVISARNITDAKKIAQKRIIIKKVKK